jgi:hypothetical protein
MPGRAKATVYQEDDASAGRMEQYNKEQRRRITKSHTFLKKINDGIFEKLKVRLATNGKTQDRRIYTDYSSPLAKTSSAMICLKVAMVKGWGLMKVDEGGAF